MLYYATDTFYGNCASDNICCIFAGFQVVLSVTGMLVDLSVTIMQVTVSVAIMQLEVSAAFMQVTVSAANMWVIIFIVIMDDNFYGNYADKSLCCNYAGGIFCSALCT